MGAAMNKSHMTSGFRLLAACALAGIGGCAGVGAVLQDYGSVHAQNIQTPIDTFRVFDKPAESKMMITPSLASAWKNGSTLVDPANDVQWRKVMEEGVYAYFKQTGRSCEIVDGHVLIQSQWEFTYRCALITSSVTPSNASQ